MKAWAKQFTKRFRRPKTVALDFDRRQLRVVHFDASRWGPRILALRSVPVPPDVDMGDAEAAGALVGQVMGEMGLAGADVLMNVPRSQAVLKALTLPAGTPEGELAGMVQYQIANELPFDAAEAVVDFTITPHTGTETGADGAEGGQDVLAAAVRLPVVDYYRRLAEVASLQPVRLCLRPASNLRCLDSCVTRRPGEFVALVDVTADETEIDFVVGASLVFSRSAPLAETAEDESGRPGMVQTVVSEVMRSLQSFQVSHRAGKLEGLLVAGQSELASEVAAALSQRLEARCQRFDPAKALDLQADSAASAFSAALGAAVGSAESAGFDFLHPRRPAVRKDDRKTRVALLAATGALVCLLLLLGCYWLTNSRNDEAKRMTAAAKNEKNLWEETVEPMSKRVRRLQEWQDSQVDWLGHLAQLSALLPGAKDIYISRLDASAGKIVNLAVRAHDRECIDQLEKLLETNGYHNKPATVTPQNDPKGLGYVYESAVPATLDANALKKLSTTVPARPQDDVSNGPAGSAIAAPAAVPAVAPAAPVAPPKPAAPPPPAGPSDANDRRPRRNRGRVGQ